MPEQRKPPDPRVDRATMLPAFVIDYSDSAFAMPHALTSADEPVFDPDAFTFVGKEMDGIESRRHRAITPLDDPSVPGFRYDPQAHNYVRVGFVQRSAVRQLEISTEWFTGNQVKEVSVFLLDRKTGEETRILEREPLSPDRKHFFAVADITATEMRIDCYPDGGIARIRGYGRPVEPESERVNILEFAHISHVSNTHYGTPADALAGGRLVAHMVGWESGRSGFGERALFHLPAPSTVEELVVDSYRHMLNTPLACYAFGLNLAPEQDGALERAMSQAPIWKVVFADGSEVVPDELRSYIAEKRYLSDSGGSNAPFTILLHRPDGSPWRPITVHARLRADALNRFTELDERGPFTHILFMHFPNGGIHGLRMYGARHV